MPQDLVKAAACYLKAAEEGKVEAQLNLGGMYWGGHGVSQSSTEAAKWFRKAAEQGDAEAQFNLGSMYSIGDGVALDYAEAAKWYRMAAEQGDPVAQWNLGSMYDIGGGVALDYAEAAKWYRMAAEQGDPVAQISLGLLYYGGDGVAQDYTDAAKWYRMAAEQGDPVAQLSLGEMYGNGQGVAQNDIEAYKWFDVAIAQAKPADFLRLGGVSLIGKRFADINGVTLGPGESFSVKSPIGRVKIRCLQVSADGAQVMVEGESAPRTLRFGVSSFFQDAVDWRNWLETVLTPEQIAEGQRRAAAFVAKAEPATGEKRPVTSTGTGFFVTDDGYLVTCEHVVDGAKAFNVRIAGASLPAKLVVESKAIDVALLKVNGSFRALPVAAESRVKLGDSVFTIGFPNPEVQGVEPKLTRGEISSLAGIQDNPRYFQISVPVQPGNSGGALVDEYGNVVGIVAARLDDIAAYESSGALPQNVNYAVKGSLVRAFLDRVPELRRKLKAPRSAKNPEGASASAEGAAVLVIAE